MPITTNSLIVLIAALAGAAVRRRVSLALRVAGAGYHVEPLDSTTAHRLPDVYVALRVDRHHVQEREVAGHVPGTTEPGQDRSRRRQAGIRRNVAGPGESGGVVEDPHDLVAAVGLVHEGLRLA